MGTPPESIAGQGPERGHRLSASLSRLSRALTLVAAQGALAAFARQRFARSLPRPGQHVWEAVVTKRREKPAGSPMGLLDGLVVAVFSCYSF
ncbi:unnamed protein product [Angiostrongylus costaricensis]|uniref:Secreted protein n=1 Tax=Angiostrongylus costaricensis TaxID=334426 RepID=A0A0R3PX61_ANGCS|nr:unnamed protein product [Angiostrongylus costaricensis]